MRDSVDGAIVSPKGLECACVKLCKPIAQVQGCCVADRRPGWGWPPPPHKNGIDSKDVAGFRRYVFTGMLTGKDKLSALAYADMFALSFYSEGFSMAILEALATGLPVVISKQCNFPEGTEYHAGFVVETDDTGGLRQSAPYCQTKLCARMGQNGWKLGREKYT